MAAPPPSAGSTIAFKAFAVEQRHGAVEHIVAVDPARSSGHAGGAAVGHAHGLRRRGRARGEHEHEQVGGGDHGPLAVAADGDVWCATPDRPVATVDDEDPHVEIEVVEQGGQRPIGDDETGSRCDGCRGTARPLGGCCSAHDDGTGARRAEEHAHVVRGVLEQDAHVETARRSAGRGGHPAISSLCSTSARQVIRRSPASSAGPSSSARRPRSSATVVGSSFGGSWAPEPAAVVCRAPAVTAKSIVGT